MRTRLQGDGPTVRRRSWLALAIALGCVGCGAPGVVLLDLDDPGGDVRLRHPSVPARAFDLTGIEVVEQADRIVVTATFASPVERLLPVPTDVDASLARYLPTVDLYLDSTPDSGHLEALEGRGFFLRAGDGWERALVMADLLRPLHPDAISATHLSARGRKLVAHFPLHAWPHQVRGVTAVVTATAFYADGFVRRVSRFKGDCSTWDDDRCTLIGEGPAVLDGSGPFDGSTISMRPVAGASVSEVASVAGDAPAEAAAAGVPVVFHRGAVVTVAPVDGAVGPGSLGTVYDADRAPLGTAVVESRVGEVATLRYVGPHGDGTPVSVVFAPGSGEKGQ